MASPPITYLSKDYDDILSDLVKYAQAAYKKRGLTDWNDFLELNQGMVFLELFARSTEFLLFYLDRQANEVYGDRSKVRRNLISILKWIAYEMETQKAAYVDATITRATPHMVDIPIYAAGDTTNPVLAKTKTDGITWQATELDKVLKAGSTSITVRFKNSQTITESFIASGSSKQTIKVSKTPFLKDGTTVVKVNGATWKETDSFIDSSPTDGHYLLNTNANDAGIVEFGDNITGRIPPAGSTIQVSYQYGGGTVGNIEVGELNSITSTILDINGVAQSLTITNPLEATPGSNRETMAKAREAGPAKLRTNFRSISLDDYEIHAKSVQGVVRVLPITSDNDSEIPENTVILMVLPTGTSNIAPDTLLDLVRDEILLKNPTRASGDILALPFTEVFSGVEATLTLSKGANKTLIDQKVRANISSLVDYRSVDSNGNFTRSLGQKIYPVEIECTIKSADSSIKGVTLTSPTGVISTKPTELLVIPAASISLTYVTET